jgi:myo-inositol-1(or 4)-monophosphatase
MAATGLTDADIDLKFLQDCLKQGGALALAQWGRVTASLKADQTPVTLVDRQVEDFLMERIGARYPTHTLLSEEGGAFSGAEDLAWVIDPIDGTRAYASGLPIWGISIGVLRGKEPHAGGFYLPVTGEMYWGTCREAYYNDQKLKPAAAPDPDSPLVFLTVPSDFHVHFEVSYPRIRSMGSTAAHLAYAATGAAIGAFVTPFSLWDLAGVLPLLAALGISVSYLSGEPFLPGDLLDGRKSAAPILAAHPQVAPLLRSSIHPVPRAK